MTRLRTAKLAGVKGVRRKVQIEMNNGPLLVPAVVYGQWAIHHCADGFTVTHAPSGLAMAADSLEDSVRRLAEGLLAVRDFRTRSKVAVDHCREVYSIWKAGN